MKGIGKTKRKERTIEKYIIYNYILPFFSVCVRITMRYDCIFTGGVCPIVVGCVFKVNGFFCARMWFVSQQNGTAQFTGTVSRETVLFLGNKGENKMEKENEKTNVCPKCGAAVKEDDAFCGNCGYALKKSDVCPVCGQPMNGGNFCSKCGYSAKQSVTGLKKNTVDTVKKKIVSFAQSAWKFIKSHKKAVIAVLIIIALTVAIVPTAVFLASPFRKGKVDKIELGSTTKEEAKKLLGDPYIQTTTTELVVENGLESIEVLRQYSFGGGKNFGSITKTQ